MTEIRVVVIDASGALHAALRPHLEIANMRVVSATATMIGDIVLTDSAKQCRDVRDKTELPIVIVTPMREEADRLCGFAAGADDYIVAPFAPRELVSRIHAIVRRTRGEVVPNGMIAVGDISIYPDALRVTVAGRAVSLSGAELAILASLARQPGRPISREVLRDLSRLGSADEVFDRAIDVAICRLRQKLGDDAREPRYVVTVRGKGYMLANYVR